MKRLLHCTVILSACLLGGMGSDEPTKTNDADVIVVGGGIAGLAAALELGRGGARVLILDMNSVAGGHAVLAGGYALVGTPLQASLGIEDSPDLALNDLMTWGETNDPDWTRFYVENSKDIVHDWLVELGVEFVEIFPAPSHSVPRFHFTKGTSAFVVVPMMQDLFAKSHIEFLGNREVKEIEMRYGAVSGVIATNLRKDTTERFAASRVVVATGGFQSNPDFVKRTWRKDIPFPRRILIGSGYYATGSGYNLAEQAGAVLLNLDRHTTFPSGIPNPRDPSGNDALLARNPFSIWLNADGKRFANENDTAKFTVPLIAQQRDGTYWSIFDEASKSALGARGGLWLTPETIEQEILKNPDVIKSSLTLEGLAQEAGLPPTAVRQTIERYNAFVEQNEDPDFGRIAPDDPFPAQEINTPPYYALQNFLVTRKSMGGIAIDMSARALDKDGTPVPGLFAAGEVTGVAGINGSIGMSGTFLGPSVMFGRIAGHTILDELVSETSWQPAAQNGDASLVPEQVQWSPEIDIPGLVALLNTPRPGHWHFEVAHNMVLEKNMACTDCHSSSMPMKASTSRAQLLAQTATCITCHNQL